jgi:hypothetical protein
LGAGLLDLLADLTGVTLRVSAFDELAVTTSGKLVGGILDQLRITGLRELIVATFDRESVATRDADRVATLEEAGIAKSDADGVATLDADGVATLGEEGVAAFDEESVASFDEEGIAAGVRSGTAVLVPEIVLGSKVPGFVVIAGVTMQYTCDTILSQ